MKFILYEKADEIWIEDIMESSEKLVDGYEERWGQSVSLVMKQSELFTSFNGDIYKFERYGEGKFCVGWVEVVDKSPVFHDDVIILGELNKHIRKKLYRMARKFNRDREYVLENVARKLLVECDEDDAFVRAGTLIKSASQHKDWEKKFSRREVKRIFEYMIRTVKVERIEILKYVPMRTVYENWWSALYYRCFDKILGCGALFGFTMLLTGKSLIIGWGLLVTFVGWLQIFNRNFFKKEFECRDIFFSKVIRQLESEYDLSEETVIEREAKEIIYKEGFVDFVLSDLDSSADFIDVDGSEFASLAQEYSNALIKSEFEGGERVDKIEFLKRLLELEKRMYGAKQTRRGRISHIDKYDVEKRLCYLGWTNEQIAEDSFVMNIMEVMDEIARTPYRGMDVELIAFVKLVVKYASIKEKKLSREEDVLEKLRQIKLQIEVNARLKATALQSFRASKVLKLKVDSIPKLESRN